MLRVTLGRLDDWNARRRALAAAYEQEGLGELVDLPEPVGDEEPVHHLYVVRTEDPDAASRALADAGIGARSYYRVPVHRQPAMAAWPPPHELPGTDAGCARRTSRCRWARRFPLTRHARWSRRCDGPGPDADIAANTAFT